MFKSKDRSNDESLKNRRNEFNISIRKRKNNQILTSKRQKIINECYNNTLHIDSNELKRLINEFFTCYTADSPNSTELTQKLKNFTVEIDCTAKNLDHIVSIFLEQSMLSPIIDCLSTKNLDSQQ